MSGSKPVASNADIKSSLGLGIVRFQEEPEAPVVSAMIMNIGGPMR